MSEAVVMQVIAIMLWSCYLLIAKNGCTLLTIHKDRECQLSSQVGMKQLLGDESLRLKSL